MAAEFLHGAPVNWIVNWGLFQKRPGGFVMGIFAGVSTAVIVSIAGMAAFNAYVPLSRPTLQLVSDSVPAGGYLGFVQSSAPVRPCQQEQVRLIWRTVNINGMSVRQTFFLSDANIPTKAWDGPTLIMLNVPAEVPPGQYHYQRQSQTWCSLVNYIFGPTMSVTADVPFQVTSAVVK